MHLDDVVTELVEHCGDRLLRVAYQLTHDAAAAQPAADPPSTLGNGDLQATSASSVIPVIQQLLNRR